MSGTDISQWLGPALQLGGFLLVIPGLIAWYRNTMNESEQRRAAGLSPEAPPTLTQRANLERALKHEPDPTEITDLRLQATALRKNRSVLLFWTAALVMQLGALVASPGLGRVVFIVALALAFAPGIIRIERNARAGDAFLRRYPPEAALAVQGNA